MVQVEFLGPIPKEAMQLEASSLHDVAKILNEDAELKTWLESAAVAVNDTLVASLDVSLNDGDKVSLLPPVCGG
jgi:molybdopterin synthase sulfur carrier subunit